MIRHGVLLAFILTGTALVCRAESPIWIVHVLPSNSADATPLLLQADGDAAPEWGVLNGSEVTIAEIAPDSPARKLSLPAETALFDLRDTDRDGVAELAVVRNGRLEYWPDAAAAAGSDPAFSIEDAAIGAISLGGPRPYPLFLENRGEDFLTVPTGGNPPIWTLDGRPAAAPLAAASPPLVRTQFHAWSSFADIAANQTSEIHISQRYEPEQARDEPAQNATSRSAGTRRARDASAAPAEEWPWFALSAESRVRYALAPPDFRDTLIRVSQRDTPRPAPQSPPSPRRFPGILIAPGETGSDFNGDGFNDLLLWRAPRLGASLDAFVRAAQDGDWDVALTVHLYDPASGRFDGRPIDWIHTTAPLEGVLAGGVRGPFGYLSTEDLDGDGRAEVLCSGAGSELSAWTFTGRSASTPWARAQLAEPIGELVLTARVPGYHWLGVVRGARAFQLVALPKR